jgi:hypothetical protein
VLRANPNQPQAAPAARVANKSTVVRYGKSTHYEKPLAPRCAECETTLWSAGCRLVSGMKYLMAASAVFSYQ